MRADLILVLAAAMALAACSSSSGGGGTAPARTYVILPNGTAVPASTQGGTSP